MGDTDLNQIKVLWIRCNEFDPLTHSSLGFNGGLPQNFTIEVIENETLDNIVFKGMSTEPVFSVTNLKDSTDYRVYVVPVNMKVGHWSSWMLKVMMH